MSRVVLDSRGAVVAVAAAVPVFACVEAVFLFGEDVGVPFASDEYLSGYMGEMVIYAATRKIQATSAAVVKMKVENGDSGWWMVDV
jgi:hypothetical protein